MNAQTKGGPRQLAALNAIKAHWHAFGESPTRKELGVSLGIDAVSAHELVCKLADSGLVVVARRQWRGIALS